MGLEGQAPRAEQLAVKAVVESLDLGDARSLQQSAKRVSKSVARLSKVDGAKEVQRSVSRVNTLVDAVNGVARSVSRKSVQGLIKAVDKISAAPRRRRRHKKAAPRCKKGYGGHCYSKSMLRLLHRVRRQLLVIKQHKKDMAYLRNRRRIGWKTKRSLGRTYGPAEAKKIALGKMTMPRGGRLVKVPVRKVRNKTQYRYRISFA